MLDYNCSIRLPVGSLPISSKYYYFSLCVVRYMFKEYGLMMTDDEDIGY